MAINNLSPTDMIKPVPPGISWTSPPKGRPWTNPPKLTKVSDVAQNYIDVLSAPSTMNAMLDVIETDVPLAAMAETMMLAGVHEGIHTVDTGILVIPVIIEMLKTAAEIHNYKYVVFPDELEKDTKVDSRIVNQAIEGAMSKKEKPVEEMIEPQVELSGLMSRNKRGTE